eukprot:1657623-Rhodomonas_salina.2
MMLPMSVTALTHVLPMSGTDLASAATRLSGRPFWEWEWGSGAGADHDGQLKAGGTLCTRVAERGERGGLGEDERLGVAWHQSAT